MVLIVVLKRIGFVDPEMNKTDSLDIFLARSKVKVQKMIIQMKANDNKSYDTICHK